MSITIIKKKSTFYKSLLIPLSLSIHIVANIVLHLVVVLLVHTLDESEYIKLADMPKSTLYSMLHASTLAPVIVTIYTNTGLTILPTRIPADYL